MPSYTLGEMMSQATYNVGRRADIPASQVSFVVNEAYMEVAHAVPHALLEKRAFSSTTSGTNRYPLPADFGTPINVALHVSNSVNSAQAYYSNKTLHRISSSQLDASEKVPGGEPKYFALFGDEIELFPSPTSAYSISLRYHAAPSDLTATDAVPSVSTPWRRAILLKTEERLFHSLGDHNGAAIARQRYLDYVHQLHTDEARRQAGAYPFGVHVIY